MLTQGYCEGFEKTNFGKLQILLQFFLFFLYSSGIKRVKMTKMDTFQTGVTKRDSRWNTTLYL